MFFKQNKMLLLWILLVVSRFNGSSSNTVVTYTTKNVEEMQCLINGNTLTASWTDSTTGDSLFTYRTSSPDIEIIKSEPKHENFNHSYEPNTHFNLIIDKVEREDEGTYTCVEIGDDTTQTVYDVTVEAIPDEISFDCYVPPDVTCPVQGVTPISELICTCAAKGVHPGTLSLTISGAENVQQDTPVANGGLFDLSLKATVPVNDSATEVTCSVNGYSTTEPIPQNLIAKTLMISPPACDLVISFDKECKEATLNCSCSAIPTDGEPPSDYGMVFSYFNGTGHLIQGNAITTVQSNDVEAGVDLTYSCRGCNGLYYGDSSYVTESKICTISTTALPTTTITTVPLSTNEPTSTKATESTTEEPKPKPTNEPETGGLGTWAIVGISLGALAVVIVIVVIALMMFKPGESGSKSESSNSGKGIENDGMESPPPVYSEVKKKSNKPDNSGAGPGVDPEIPTYGTNDKKMTKDQAHAPHSSMRDSTYSSKPKQDMEMKYADLDHGNTPPSDEVRKPKKEPTEYATVQPVIV